MLLSLMHTFLRHRFTCVECFQPEITLGESPDSIIPSASERVDVALTA